MDCSFFCPSGRKIGRCCSTLISAIKCTLDMETTAHHTGTEVPTATQEKDIGIIITENLKVSEQCAKVTNTANKVLGIIKWSYDDKSIANLPPLYKALVRPRIEYCVQAWRPYYQKLRKDPEKSYQDGGGTKRYGLCGTFKADQTTHTGNKKNNGRYHLNVQNNEGIRRTEQRGFIWDGSRKNIQEVIRWKFTRKVRASTVEGTPSVKE